MSAEIDPKLIKRTQDTLGRIIKKPPLTEKLLSRPPFRFLHDICTAIIRTTGVMKGLFTADELIADNVKEKETKVVFLQKVIDFLTVVHERPVPVRIQSIIAGKEPDKTNELLCLLAEAINKGINNDDCVQRALQGGVPETQKRIKVGEKGEEESTAATAITKKTHASEEPPAITSESRRENQKEKTSSKSRKSKEKVEDKPSKPHESSKHSELPKEHGGSAEKRAQPQVQKKHTSRRQSENRKSEQQPPHSGRKSEKDKVEVGRTSRQSEKSRSSRNEVEQAGDEGAEKAIPNIRETAKSPQLVGAQRPCSAKGNRVRKSGDEQPPTQPSPSGTPKPEITPSARLAPPRPRRTADVVLEEGQTLMNAGGALGQRVSGLIIEEQQNSDEDDEADARFVIEETVGGGALGERTDLGDLPQEGEEVEADHGGLVAKLLQSKKELEAGNLMPNQKAETNIQVTSGNVGLDEATRQRERAAIEKEMERLCQSLQSLSRSALPLGKLMDFIQEDMESMQQEFERWKNENQSLQLQLKEEQSLTQSSVEPLKNELVELEQLAVEQRTAIASYKARIMQNDEKIHEMLSRTVEKIH